MKLQYHLQYNRRLFNLDAMTHVLEIETGRHQKLKVEERVCKLCKEAVETVEYFLRFCPKYSGLRYR